MTKRTKINLVLFVIGLMLLAGIVMFFAGIGECGLITLAGAVMVFLAGDALVSLDRVVNG